MLGKEYNFLDKLPVMLLTYGGSHAYGTNIETSDVDIRGVMENTRDEILLMQTPSQYIDNETDTTIYSFNKMVKLLLNCNPNVIEILGCKDYLKITETGQMLLDNRDAFISKRCLRSFGGYAYQQLNRLENALARDRLTQENKEEHILHSVQSAMLAMEDRYKDFGEGIHLHIEKSEKEDYDSEICADMNLKDYPVRDLHGIMEDFSNITKNYNKIGNRNHKKDDAHLNKHAMHLVRLYLMVLDLLDGEIVTYRKERALLLDIRNGKYMKEDGTYQKEFFELVDSLKNQVDVKKEKSTIPDKPDMKRIEKLVREVNLNTVMSESV